MKITTPYKDAIPPLSTVGRADLEKSIVATGKVLYPIVLTTDGEILDGHNRYEIATKKGLPYKTITLKESKGWTDEQKRWRVEEFAIATRNLSVDQLAFIRSKRNKRILADRKTGMTQKAVGAKYGIKQNRVSQIEVISSTDNTSKPDARVKVNADGKKEIVKRVAAGETQVQVAADYGITQKQVSNIKAQADKIHTRDDDKSRKTAKLKKKACDVRKGDFRKVLSDIEGASLILTDPPYGKEFIPLWHDLGEWANEALNEDGILIAYSGQMYLPQVLTELSKSMTYWWCGAVIHKGSGNLTPLGHPVRKVINQWKPLVMFIPKKGIGYQGTFRDLVRGTGAEKDKHNWQQPEAEAGEIVKAYTKEGDLVVDPFAGSGGFCKAAKDLGRIAIGAEIL